MSCDFQIGKMWFGNCDEFLYQSALQEIIKENSQLRIIYKLKSLGTFLNVFLILFAKQKQHVRKNGFE